MKNQSINLDDLKLKSKQIFIFSDGTCMVIKPISDGAAFSLVSKEQALKRIEDMKRVLVDKVLDGLSNTD